MVVINYYNLAAEYASLLIICVAMIGFVLEKSVISTRYKGLKWMYYSVLVSIIITITCLTISNDYKNYSVELIDFLRILYFITSPALSLLYSIYGMSIVYNKLDFKEIVAKFSWVVVPYIIYIIFVLSNYYHRTIFTISPELGYIKGPLYRVSYYIAIIYFIILVVFTIKHIKTPQKNVLLIICFNFLLSIIIFCMQIFLPLIQLSGLACVSGLLVVHLYILSVSKSKDSLTEINNRLTLTMHLSDLCANETPFSLVVFSLRNFKSINERLGLKFGDELLCELALCFRKVFSGKNIYRYSGDEFAYLKIGSDNFSFNERLKEVIEIIYKPFKVGEAYITLDLVYARIDYPEFGLNVKEIISSMDYSISAVKRNSGETNFFYDLSVCDKMKRRNYVIERIKEAIANDGFNVNYQGIYSAEDKNFSMAEALVRMKMKDGITISPSEFIPIAEEIGLVSKITYIVLEKVCQDFSKLIEIYKEELPLKTISINFPYVHFLQKTTVDEVMEIMNRHNMLPERINLELTERTLVSDIVTANKIMKNLIDKGFEFELDDFGIEYSNLSMFFDLPAKIIKFDASLVRSATSTKERKVFFEHLLKALKALDIKVVMEGVEDEELLKYLLKCGCDYIQGYVYTKPLEFTEFEKFLIDNN